MASLWLNIACLSGSNLPPLQPSTHRGEAPGADKLSILREEDTSVSPPLLDQGGRFTVAIPC
jgi:hypothetical protein